MTRAVSVDVLERAGLEPEEAERRAALFDRVALTWPWTDPPSLAWHVPGRIEVLGKHTDYAGGRSVVCATEQGFAFLARPRSDRVLRLFDAVRSEARDGAISVDQSATLGDWSNYPMTAARRLAADFGIERGADIAFASDVPFAAGVSSSSALLVGTALALMAVNRLEQDSSFAAAISSPEEFGGYLGAVENGRPFGALRGSGGVGTLGGSQDQTAILCSRPNALAQYRFDPVELEGVMAWPDRLSFVIAASGVVAEKTGAAIEHYNALARLTSVLSEHARAIYGDQIRSLGAALIDHEDAPSRIGERIASLGDPRLAARLAQLTAECRLIIPGVHRAFTRGDLRRVGELVELSQEGAELGLGNQIPETRALVEMARIEGAIAASAFGAGFGGSVWAIVDRGDAPRFRADWLARYRSGFPERRTGSAAVITRPAIPATRLFPDSGR
ncbi:MAG: galactokinase [Gemmatimonadetes bacterium]|nr:galactokinase [Gemmatimonadota bacterium]